RLHGKVAPADETARGEGEAKKVDGVKSVRNLLQVVSSRHATAVKVTDAQLKDRVTKALKADRSLDDGSIAVAAGNDRAGPLSGTAASASDHLRAIQTARA